MLLLTNENRAIAVKKISLFSKKIEESNNPDELSNHPRRKNTKKEAEGASCVHTTDLKSFFGRL